MVTALSLVVKPALAVLFLIPQTHIQQVVPVVTALLSKLQLQTLAMLFVIAGADFLLKKHFHKKGLMMSKEEVKQEHKQSQGDPHVKGQRKQMARQIANDPGKASKVAKRNLMQWWSTPPTTPLPCIMCPVKRRCPR